MSAEVEAAKGDFERTIGRLLNDLAETPDEKLTWSPSSTARTPLEIAFHISEVIAAIHASLDGTLEFPSETPAEMDAACREQEKNTGSREEIVKTIEERSAAYADWLGTVTDETMAKTWNSPFGPIPYTVAISLPTYHTAGHIAQIEYIQTIYGDRVWH